MTTFFSSLFSDTAVAAPTTAGAPAWCPLPLARFLLSLAVCVLVLAAAPVSVQGEQPPGPGGKLYGAHCSQCHGEEGDGHGHAYDAVYPRPRDLTSGMYKFRTTESGEPPMLEDLVGIIANGMPGTAMPPWQGVLSRSEIGQVAGHVQSFYVEEDDEAPEHLAVGEPPAVSPQLIARGRELFEKLECARCHGEEGRGDGQRAATLTEDWNGEPIHPRNLTAGWLFRGGRGARDIYRTVLYGLNGTPMPAHNEEELLAKEEDRWALAHFIRSLGPGPEPEVKSTLIAKWMEGEIPLADDDPAWEQARGFYIPLAGQVMVEERLFQPSVPYLWFRALYNDREIGFRVRWVDATAKGSPALLEALQKAREDAGEEETAKKPERSRDKPAGGAGAPPADGNPVDELVLQFPAKYRVGKPLPYFLMGKPGRPVRLWVWRSDREPMAVAKATGVAGRRVAKEAAGMSSRLNYRHGLYTLTVKRRRLTEDGKGVQFASQPGLMPISFSVVDGFKGEGGSRRAVATWYTLLLEKPVAANVFYIPILVICLLAAVEWRLVSTARKKQGRAPTPLPRAKTPTQNPRVRKPRGAKTPSKKEA